MWPWHNACCRGSPRTTARLFPSVAPAFSGEPAAGREPATQTHPKYSNPTPYRQLIPLALSFLIAQTARTPMLCRTRLSASASLLLSFTALALAQTAPRPATHPSSQSATKTSAPAATPREQRAIRAFDTAKQSPLELSAFLTRMPKGADLHMHLSGAVYAETFIKDAAADLLCVNPATMSFIKPAATTRSLPPQPVCDEGNVRAENAFKDQRLYDALIDSFSMRSFVPSAGISRHDQFFATFSRFGG